MNTKHTPKSCSCTQCKRGKGSTVSHILRNKDEKSLRQRAKQALRRTAGTENNDGLILPSAPIGGFFD